MNQIDSRILNALQSDFPISKNPYQLIADQLGIPHDQFMERIKHLIKTGIIRRVGASLDSHKLGYRSTLAAISIPKEQVESASELIGGFAEVTHSYLRKDEFNIWFTIIAESKQRIEDILSQIQKTLSLSEADILYLPVKRLFKLDARFKLAP